jgi:hypothetical protein
MDLPCSDELAYPLRSLGVVSEVIVHEDAILVSIGIDRFHFLHDVLRAPGSPLVQRESRAGAIGASERASSRRGDGGEFAECQGYASMCVSIPYVTQHSAVREGQGIQIMDQTYRSLDQSLALEIADAFHVLWLRSFLEMVQ